MFIRNVECASSSSWTPQDDFVLIAEGEGGGLFVPSGVTPISTGGLSAADTSNSPPRRRQGGDRLAFDRSPPRARSKEDPLDDPSLLGRDIFRGRSLRCHGLEAGSSPYLVGRDFYVADRRGATAFPYTAKELAAPVPVH